MNQGQLVPLIKTVHAATLIEMLKHFEADIYPLLKTAGLPEDILQTHHEFVPESPIKHLLAMMAERADPDHYGNLLRTAIREYFIPKMLRHLHNPKSIGEAIEQMQTAVQHDSPSAKVSLEYFNDTPWFCRHKPKEVSEGFLWAEIFAILFLIEFIRFASKTQWQPGCIAVQSPNADKLAEILNSPDTVLYSNRSLAAIELSNDLLAMPFNLPVRFTPVDKQANDPKPLSYVETVYLALAPYLSRQALSIQQAAVLMNTSPRTLQRRLSGENTSYKSIRENIMLATACQLMENRQYSLTDIASELGYADIAHFSRAFKKLTGFPPKDYRKRFRSKEQPLANSSRE
ncbi:AraC family transcriptional regulator [Photobacterium proteolyticum]|uniref:AraC family transcriptional regulator n=1 Tax=Photobacterium proteolyticum TaxID=1903952 RepID=A0A1Q9GEF0_9GAMM|nr:AraC family transcriptional regulator [Photobacterium proteolyticum]OLQ72785.1 AraC family transcriptional regulator [Photobacterium proteolyticum]